MKRLWKTFAELAAAFAVLFQAALMQWQRGSASPFLPFPHRAGFRSDPAPGNGFKLNLQ